MAILMTFVTMLIKISLCNIIQRGSGSETNEINQGPGSGRPTVTDPPGSGTLLNSLSFDTLFNTFDTSFSSLVACQCQIFILTRV
jgi:hypothetical protein